MRSMMGEERGTRSILELKRQENDQLPLISPIAKARWVPFFSPLARGEGDWVSIRWQLIETLPSRVLPPP